MPSAEELFQRFFLPLYPARVDFACSSADDGSSFAALNHAAEAFARFAPAELGDPDLVLDFTDESMRRLAKALTRGRRDAWLVEEMYGAPKIIAIITKVVENMRAAQWIIRAVEQRRKIILRVTELILQKQKELFEKGIEHLKPMSLHEVAEGVGMPPSTISRVVRGKFAHTPQGVFELSYFFESEARN